MMRIFDSIFNLNDIPDSSDPYYGVGIYCHTYMLKLQQQIVKVIKCCAGLHSHIVLTEEGKRKTRKNKTNSQIHFYTVTTTEA